MDKKKLIITIVSAVVVVAAIIAIITSSKNTKNEDAIKFAKEYSSVTEDNVFVYKTADEIIKNTYRTLMTRGMKGCYVYCVDEKLAEYLKSSIGKEETNDTGNN